MSADVCVGAPTPEAPGLRSPPDSNGKVMESESELSDIEEDGRRVEAAVESRPEQEERQEQREEQREEQRTGDRTGEETGEQQAGDIGEVKPDHYDDESGVPVFKPPMAQFKEFEQFVCPTHSGRERG